MAAEKLEPFAALKLGNYYREGSKALNIPQNPSMSHYFSTIAFAYGLSENAKTVAGPLATAAEKATAENIQMKVQSEAEETSDEKKSSTSIGTVGPASIEAQSAVGMDKKPLEISDVSPCPKAGEKTQTTNVAEEAKAPIIMYSVASRTGLNIAPETAAELIRDVDNIVGIKEASGNIAQVAKIMYLTDGKQICIPEMTIRLYRFFLWADSV